MKNTLLKIILSIFFLTLVGFETHNNTTTEINSVSYFQTINGLYTYSDSSLKSEVQISGASWRRKVILHNIDTSYDSGIVKNSDLYDSSGLYKLGSTNGKTVKIAMGNKVVIHYKK